MTTVTGTLEDVQPPLVRTRERGRGLWGMWLVIATEGMLFAMLFFGYFYLMASKPQWPLEKDPSVRYALVLLAILVASSFVASWGERGIRELGKVKRLNIGLGITILLGAAFLVIQYFEYQHHLKELTPTENAYGSIFYTITSFHMAHVIVGMMMLIFVFARSLAGHFDKDRHLAVKNTVLYWHFVDIVWVFVVSILYISPRFYGE